MIKEDSFDYKTSLTLQLRNAAMVERDTKVKERMKYAADRLTAAIKHFWVHPDGEALTDLQCAWSHGVRILNSATDPNGDSGGQSGTGAIDGGPPLMAIAA